MDMTGLEGVFDISLDFVTDGLSADNNSGPDIFSAVQALGLKLESRKSAFEVLVIDSAEKASGN